MDFFLDLTDGACSQLISFAWNLPILADWSFHGRQRISQRFFLFLLIYYIRNTIILRFGHVFYFFVTLQMNNLRYFLTHRRLLNFTYWRSTWTVIKLIIFNWKVFFVAWECTNFGDKLIINIWRVLISFDFHLVESFPFDSLLNHHFEL